MSTIMNKDERLCWFHGKLSREAADEILLAEVNSEDGTFLVRESNTAVGDFVLSLLYRGEVCHYQIRRYGEDAFFSIEDKVKILHGLDTLVDFYQQDANGLVTKLTRYIKKDPPPNDTRSHGNTNLLHRAVMKNNHIIVSELLKCGYRNVDAKNQDGQTAVHLAALHADEPILQLLINAGVNVNCMDTDNYMPLHYACRHQSRSFIRSLLAIEGVNIQGRNIKNGYVPLHEAAKHGNLSAVEELLSANAPLLPRTAMGEFPIDLAKEFNNKDVVTFLENYKLPAAKSCRSQWYHGTLRREEAIELLQEYATNLKKQQQLLDQSMLNDLEAIENSCSTSEHILDTGLPDITSGAFLIRISERKNTGYGYVLTMLYNNVIKNFIISQSSNYLFIDDGPFLPSLEHLVDHFMRFSDGLPTTLKYAVPPKPKPPLPLFSTMPRHPTQKKKPIANVDCLDQNVSSTFQRSFSTNDQRGKFQQFQTQQQQEGKNLIGTSGSIGLKKKNKDTIGSLLSSGTNISVFSTLRTLRSPKKTSILDSMTTLKRYHKQKSNKTPVSKSNAGIGCTPCESIDFINDIDDDEKQSRSSKTTKRTLEFEDELNKLRQTENFLRTLSFSTDFNNLNLTNDSASSKCDENAPINDQQYSNSNEIKELMTSDTFYNVPRNNAAITSIASNNFSSPLHNDEEKIVMNNITKNGQKFVNNNFISTSKSEMEVEYFTKSDLIIERERQYTEKDRLIQCSSNENLDIEKDVTKQSECRREEQRKDLEASVGMSTSHSYVDNANNNEHLLKVYIADSNYLLSSDQLILESIIGEGEFGSVYRGRLKPSIDKNNIKTTKINHSNQYLEVAIKTLRNEHCPSNKEEFLREASVMIHLKHHCIVQLIGIVRGSGETLMMVQELVPLGSMLNYIILNKEKINVNYELKLWASQIACGMQYLESQHFVHRDLAARNILLSSRNQAKISDFGLSRALGADNDCYQASQGGKWPIKWYAPESFNNGLFSHASDVWSFGITLWEMFSLGESPYGEMRGVDAIQYIEKGERLQRPPLCPEHIYEIMHNCWNYIPGDRPTFYVLQDFFSRDPDYQNIIELIQTEHIS